MSTKHSTGIVDYEKVSKVTGKSLDSIRQDRCRGALDLDDLRNLILYVARRGPTELKTEIIAAMTDPDSEILATSAKLQNKRKTAQAARKAREAASSVSPKKTAKKKRR